MNFLIVNDDGIDSPNLRLLAEMTKAYGDVTIVAPVRQCSAMSQRITVKGILEVREVKDYPLPGVKAYSVNGTPADCVKIGLRYCFEEKPDFVFSGINLGINVGYDICYSGTVAAAIEGAMHEIPSIAWSMMLGNSFQGVQEGETAVAKRYFSEVFEMLQQEPPAYGHIWNVNFPNCAPEDCKGILKGLRPADAPHYADGYKKVREDEDGGYDLDTFPVMNHEAPEGTDLNAVVNGYISVGDCFNPIMCYGREKG